MPDPEEPKLQGSPSRQPATPPLLFGARRPKVGVRMARRGGALVRMVALVALSAFLVAAVLATVLGALVIVVNGRLP
ncbi:MAG TPA: hypothetical protein VGA11_01455 [Acidimicrobiia bacterium]